MNIRELAGAIRARIDLSKIGENFDVKDAFAFGGLALVTVGAAQVYPPAGWIVPGAFFMWLGVSK